MARHIACLTFDVDVMTGFIARGMTTPTPISRGEFGLVALPRILQLLGALRSVLTLHVAKEDWVLYSLLRHAV